MDKRDKASLLDILESLREVEEFTKGMSYGEFVKDKRSQRAIERVLTIIGEATKRMSEDLRKRTPKIPWKKIAGMRDVLMHEYGEIKIEKVWRTVKEDVPPLLEDLNKIFEKKFGEE